MKIMKSIVVKSLLALLLLANVASAAEPLPSWNDTVQKKAIITFVEQVTREGSPNFVPPAERIATFDNDGTLWSEQPMYFQMAFMRDRIRALAPQHPEWKNIQPFKAVLEGDMKAVSVGGQHALVELIMATHTGYTTEEFAQIVKDWLVTARHPKTGRPYTEMVYQPMFELLAYLCTNGFKTYIVSGGSVEFMRPWTEKVYGFPPSRSSAAALRRSSSCATVNPC
jgi:hypothetical protein